MKKANFRAGFNYFLLALAGLLVSCIETVELPLVETAEVTEIEQLHAVSGGSVTDFGGGEVTDCGICWSTSENPTVSDSKVSCGHGKNSFVARLIPLTAATRYYVRAYAVNVAGTAYGKQIDFVTAGLSKPGVLTNGVTVTGTNTAIAGGLVYNSGGTQITEKGICWSTRSGPTVSDNKVNGTDLQYYPGMFSCTISGLNQGTDYYVRAYAVNEAGTSYGYEFRFTTLSINPPLFNSDLTYGSLMDIDGNIYKTIDIGSQTWMAENLRTTRYNDGAEIPVISSDNAWSDANSGARCWYRNDLAQYGNIYGGYYNYYAVSTKKLCPSGWHVPDKSEWLQLINFLGGDIVAGGKMKETGNYNWIKPNVGATNESGFTALPGSYRPHGFLGNGRSAYWWSGTKVVSGWNTTYEAYCVEVGKIFINSVLFYPDNGLNVRCVKD